MSKISNPMHRIRFDIAFYYDTQKAGETQILPFTRSGSVFFHFRLADQGGNIGKYQSG